MGRDELIRFIEDSERGLNIELEDMEVSFSDRMKVLSEIRLASMEILGSLYNRVLDEESWENGKYKTVVDLDTGISTLIKQKQT